MILYDKLDIKYNHAPKFFRQNSASNHRVCLEFSCIWSLVLIIFFLTTAHSNVYVPLNGEQCGEYSTAEYIVSKTIVIPLGKTMTIESGSIIRFKQFTGIKVEGTLICKNSPGNSTLFTSKDQESEVKIDLFGDTIQMYNTGQMDAPVQNQWNGINICITGSAMLENVRIENSVYGIKIDKDTSKMKFEGLSFWNNDQDFSVEGTSIEVDHNKPFDYKTKINLPPPPVITKTDTIVQIITKESTDSENVNTKTEQVSTRGKWELPVRVSLTSLAIAGGVLCYVYNKKALGHQEEANNATDKEALKDATDKGNTEYILRNTFGAIGAASVLCLTITFFF